MAEPAISRALPVRFSTPIGDAISFAPSKGRIGPSNQTGAINLGGISEARSAAVIDEAVPGGTNSHGYSSGAENVAQFELLKAECRALDVNSQVGIPVTRSTNQ